MDKSVNDLSKELTTLSAYKDLGCDIDVLCTGSGFYISNTYVCSVCLCSSVCMQYVAMYFIYF